MGKGWEWVNQDFVGRDLVVDFGLEVLFVIGGVVLPEIPVAESVSGDLDFETGEVTPFMAQFLAHVHEVFFLPENQHRRKHHHLVETHPRHQVYVSQVS